MSKTRYIKGKDGKFAGSIGAGKQAVPTSAPLPPRDEVVAAAGDLAAIPTPPQTVSVPSYLLDPHLETLDDLSTPPGRPDLTERSTWSRPVAQQSLEEHFLHGPTGLFTALTDTVPTQLSHHPQLHDLYARAETRARELRDNGLHHQAAAVEWVAGCARGLSHDVYDIHEDMVWTNDNPGAEFGAGSEATILVRDSDHRFALIADAAGVAVIDPSRDWEVDRNHAYAVTDPDFVIPVDDMRSHAREMFTGAVIMDYLSLTGGDVEAAAVWGSLTP